MKEKITINRENGVEEISIERRFDIIYRQYQNKSKKKGKEEKVYSDSISATLEFKNDEMSEIWLHSMYHACGFISLFDSFWIRDIEHFEALHEIINQLASEIKREGLDKKEIK